MPNYCYEKMKRDSWMTEEADIYKSSAREMKKFEVDKLKADMERKEREDARAVKQISNKKYEYGDRGSAWRMMKLSKVAEIAKEEGRTVQDVALERYGSMEDYQEALNEQEYLQRNGKQKSNPNTQKHSQTFGDYSGERKFRAPDQVERKKVASTKDIETNAKPKVQQDSAPRYVLKEEREPILSRDELNSLQAKVLKATFKKSKDLESLKAEYDFQLQRTESFERNSSGSKIKDQKPRQEPLQPKEDHEKSLQELVKEEKTSKSRFDDNMVKNIMRDQSFENDHEYMDEQGEKLAVKPKEKERDYKKQRREYNMERKRLQELDSCEYCIVDGIVSSLSIVAQGTRVYLALPNTVDMMPYHCLIIPKSHETSTLDLDDDDWTEIRNFQKCITRMYDSIGKTPLFMEQTVDGKHTFIECFPLSQNHHADSYQWYKVNSYLILGSPGRN